MSMQISVDPAALSQEQREAVAGFILAYPSSAGTCGHAVAEIPAFIHKDTADAGLVEVGKAASTFKAYQPQEATDEELETLQHDHESTMPAAAFGNLPQGGIAYNDPPGSDPVAVFGVPAAPLAGSTPVIAGASTVAPPPPANTAPITTTPGVASSAAGASSAGVELDKHGLPWDGRIHAESKGKLTDGSWRKKRQVDPALVAQVEAELRQVMGAAPAAPLAPAAAIPAQPAATVTTPTPGVASSAVAVPVPPIAPPPPAPSAPVAPVAGAAPTMPAAPNVAPAGDVPQDARQQFVGLVGRASAAIQGGKVTQAEVNQICADSGIPALPLLANRLDLVATVASRIDALIAARGQ